MPKRSNVTCASNIYVIDKSFRDDKNFQAQVRGRENLKKMLRILSGKAWIQGYVSVDEDIYMLTDLQRQEWKEGMYCALLGDKEENVFGTIRTGHKEVTVCRCYKINCELFSACRSDYNENVQLSPPPEIRNIVSDQEFKITAPPKRYKSEIITDNEDYRSVSIDVEQEDSFDDMEFVDETAREESEDEQEKTLENQIRVIESEPHDKILVLAGPGTGKTFCLIEKLKYMVEQDRKLEAENIFLLCFTRAAVKEVRDRLEAEVATNLYSDDLSRIEVRTFDSFATRVLIHLEEEFYNLDYDQRIERAIDVIQENPEILENMGHFLVDEIQDLVGVRARFVKCIIENAPSNCGVTLLGDHLQGIYDYQVSEYPEELDAVDLIEWFRKSFEQSLIELTLSLNIRQSGPLAAETAKLRTLLNKPDGEKIDRFMFYIRNKKNAGKENNFCLPEEGKTAILCRTNGEVLKISANLRKRNIQHTVKRKHNKPLTPAWIFDYCYHSNNRMDINEFTSILVQAGKCNKIDSENIFKLLMRITDDSGSFLSVNKLIEHIMTGYRLPDELYENDDSNITVSTIHQSKGREYDFVLMTEPWDRKDTDKFDEAKVNYVAVTRAKQEVHIIRQSDRRAWVKEETDYTGNRWTEQYRYKGKRKIRRLEIGKEEDVDETSFVRGNFANQQQSYIKEYLHRGSKVVLERSDNGLYIIKHESNEIGYMSIMFNKNLVTVLRNIYGRNMNYYPTKFDEIYVERIYTVIKKPETLDEGIQSIFGESGVWLGISLIGLGLICWSIESDIII